MVKSLNIRIIIVGKIRNNFIKAGVNEYVKRLLPFTNIKIESLASFSELPEKPALRKEEEIIIKTLKDKKSYIVLDREGKQFSSEEFSKIILDYNKKPNTSEIIFIIGGIYGVSESIKKEADIILSLSKMTFTHEFALLLLLEQIYRAIKILRNEPYHY